MQRNIQATDLDLNRLHDEAHARARALRDEALDDFWRGADALLREASASAARAARRFAASLRRHRGQRPAEPEGCAAC